MEDNIIIYAAGNPDAYPLEYYDDATDNYQGVIPELFREFSENSPYQISYYQPGKTDSRQDLAEHLQVDIISGCRAGEELPESAAQTELFTADIDGEEVQFLLCFTEAAPDGFVSEFKAYLEHMSSEKISGLLIEQSSQTPEPHSALTYAAGGLALALAVFCTVLLVLLRKYRARLAQARRDIESDEVTGLGNQDYLQRYYRQFVSDESRVLYSLVYFYIDTERLRRLSSSEETDEILRHCAVILKEYTADSDILARVSESGFALLRLSADKEELIRWIRPIFYRIHDYTRQYGTAFEVNVTAGIYMLRPEDRDLEEMIFNASQGAHMAEKEQQEYVFCSEGVLQKLAEERQLQAGIERAFANREFQLYIQFYVSADSGRMVGGEALSRWSYPQKGLLLPGVFVPMMEREKMISRLDYYCLREVCGFLQNLYDRHIDTFFMSCNFSRETFAAADFVEKCGEIMNAFTFPRELLIFEITESVSAKNLAQIKRNITALKDLGVSIALDDFGEGFTSFYDLQEYSFDSIKLDKGLVDNILTEKGEAILRAMIQVGHELGMTILAEGVESDEQAVRLKNLNCDVIQGFRFYHPLPAWEAEKKILEQFPG